MAFLDLCRNANPATSNRVPYLLVVQQPLLDSLPTRLVIPAFRSTAVPKPIQRLHPVVQFAGETLVLVVPEMAGVPASSLGAVAGNLAESRAAVVAAINFMVAGV